MALFLVGTGLSEGDMTERAVEACISAGELFIDPYTSVVHPKTINRISKLAGKDPTALSRSDMEEKANVLVAKAKTKDIAILVGGDPLIATTHKILFIEARRQGVRFYPIHSTSIFSVAIGESGLDFYRFGKTFTIPKWSDHYKPVSFYETLKANMGINAHSVVLLDFDQQTSTSMEISEALQELEAAEEKYREGIITQDMKLFIMSNLCAEGEVKKYITLADAKKTEFAKAPALLIIPAKLKDIENEAVASMFGD